MTPLFKATPGEGGSECTVGTRVVATVGRGGGGRTAGCRASGACRSRSRAPITSMAASARSATRSSARRAAAACGPAHAVSAGRRAAAPPEREPGSHQRESVQGSNAGISASEPWSVQCRISAPRAPGYRRRPPSAQPRPAAARPTPAPRSGPTPTHPANELSYGDAQRKGQG